MTVMRVTPRGNSKRGERFWIALGNFITHRPALVLALAAAVAVFAAISAGRLRPQSTLDAMLVEGVPACDAMARIMRDFHVMDELLVIVTAPAGRDDGTTVGSLLSFAERFAAAFDQSDELFQLCERVIFRESPDVAAFVENEMIPHGLYYVDDQILSDIRARLTPHEMREQISRAVSALSAPGIGGGSVGRLAVRDPLGLRDFLPDLAPPVSASSDGYRFSSDRTSLLIRLPGKRPVSDLDYARALTQAAQRTAGEVNSDGLEIQLTGGYAIAAASERAIRSDMIRSVTVSLLLLQALFLLVYRHVFCFPIAVAPVALGILAGFGVFAVFSTHLTPLTAVTGAVLAGLGIDYSIHYLSHYESRRAAGDDDLAAARQALRDIGPTLANACGTSLIGFLAITQSNVAALREFALVGTLGLAGALIATLLVLPAFLALLARWPHRRLNLSAIRIHLGATAGLSKGRPVRWQTASLVFMAAAAALAVGSPEGLRFESDLTVMHPRPNPALEAHASAARRFGYAVDPFLLLLHGNSPENLVHLAHQADHRLAELGRQWEDDLSSPGPRGIRSLSLARLLPDPVAAAQRAVSLNDWDIAKILADFDDGIAHSPFSAEALADYRRFLERLLAASAWPDLESLRNHPAIVNRLLPASAFTSGAGLPAEALTLVQIDEPPVDRSARNAVIEQLRAALADLPGATLTGTSVIAYETERMVRRDLRRLLSVSAIIVIVWLLLFFRSAADAMWALSPTLFSFCALAGLLAIFDLRLNAVNLIAIPLLVGLGVDNGIILVSAARNARRAGLGSPPVESLAPPCHALTMTAATTFLTFGTLVWTSTPAISSLGTLMGAGIAATLAGSVFLLVPALLRRM